MWKLPIVFVIENNGYAMGTAVKRSSAETHFYRRGTAFRIPGMDVNGMDVLEVRQAAEDLRSTIYFARSEAIKRGGNVSFAANAGSWTAGWAVASGADTLQQTANSNGVGVTVTAGGAAQTAFDVTRWGMLALTGTDAAVATTILVAPKGKDGASPNASLLCVGVAGRIEAKYGASQTC